MWTVLNQYGHIVDESVVIECRKRTYFAPATTPTVVRTRTPPVGHQVHARSTVQAPGWLCSALVNFYTI